MSSQRGQRRANRLDIRHSTVHVGQSFRAYQPMILLLLVLYFNSQAKFTEGTPLFDLRDNFTAVLDVPLPTACACPDRRSTWDIVWSSLATIFACSWVAVHPDIPTPDAKWWQLILQRIEHMFWTVVTPELMIYWAARQWFGMHYILRSRSYSGLRTAMAQNRWTRTHAHFLQMGGFTLFEGTASRGVLSASRLGFLLGEKKVTFPMISLHEIEGRSKNDGLSKLLAIGQTTWYIAQVIARKTRGLEITNLEIATLAFAVLNATMYFFWWDKPFDIRTSIPIVLQSLPSDSPQFPHIVSSSTPHGLELSRDQARSN